MSLRWQLFLALPAAGCTAAVLAQAPVAAPTAVPSAPAASRAAAMLDAERPSSWASLSPSQRATLAPLQREWGSIDASRQRKWLELAARFPRLSPQEQQRVQQRMADWARMTPEERGRARVQFQEIRQLGPQDRQAGWEAYQALPPEQRRELAQQAEPAPARGAASGAAPTTKSSIVRTPTTAPVLKPVAPTLVQVAPGATTTPVTRPPAPPLHQQAGLPKMAATPAFVDRNTLLPKRGAQAAGTLADPAASQSERPR